MIICFILLVTGQELKLREVCDDLLGPMFRSRSQPKWAPTVLVSVKLGVRFGPTHQCVHMRVQTSQSEPEVGSTVEPRLTTTSFKRATLY